MAEIAQGPANTFATPPTYDTSINSTGHSSLTRDCLETRHSALMPEESKETDSAMAMWEVVRRMDPEQKAKVLREAGVLSGS